MFSKRHAALYTVINSQISLYAIPLLLGGISFLYRWNLQKTQKTELQNYVLGVTDQSAKSLNTQINSDLQALKTTANFIELIGLSDADEIMEILDMENSRNTFRNMGVIDHKGLAKGTNSIFYNALDRGYFMRTMDSKRINVYAVSIVPEYVVSDESNKVLLILSIVSIIFLLNCISKIQKQSRMKMQQLAYTDNLTHSRNWNGLRRATEALFEFTSENDIRTKIARFMRKMSLVVEFIPLFERNGFVVQVDFFILEEICKKIRQ